MEKSRLLDTSAESIRIAAQALRRGLLVAVPTETVYGLGADAFQSDAVARVFAAKGRPGSDPLIVHVPNTATLAQVIAPQKMSALARKRFAALAAAFWPGPLTMVVPKSERISDAVTAASPYVAVRMSSHPVLKVLLETFGGPIVAPSANRFCGISPTCAEDVLAELGDRVPFVLNGGRTQVGVESTIVFVEDAVILRPGGIPSEKIEHVLQATLQARAPQTLPAAPGSLARHYSPTKPLILAATQDELIEKVSGLGRSYSRIGVLAFSEATRARIDSLLLTKGKSQWIVKSLSMRGETTEAAHHLFGSLRELDTSVSEIIVAELCPTNAGLGRAINDRLTRAAGQGT